MNFYAGRSKVFPKDAVEAAEQASEHGYDGAEAAARFRASPYENAATRPARHFFDSRYRLGIDARSDIDFSISGPSVDERMTAFQAEHPDIADLISSHGGVYKTRYLRLVFPHLDAFMDFWTDELDREVNIVGRTMVKP